MKIMAVEMKEKSTALLQERRKMWLSAIAKELENFKLTFTGRPQMIGDKKYDQVYRFSHGGCFVFTGSLNDENFQFRYFPSQTILDKDTQDATVAACLCISDMVNEPVIVFDRGDSVGEEIALWENRHPSIKVE